MSKKHVDEYFNVVAQNYHEMIEALREIEEEASNGLVDPDRIENAKKLVEPIKQNYMRISYIMFLLNKPNIKKKEKRYEAQEIKRLENIGKENTLDGVVKENKETIKNIRL